MAYKIKDSTDLKKVILSATFIKKILCIIKRPDFD